METVYIQGDFKEFIDTLYEKGAVSLENVEGKNRWVVTRDDGTKYIARPEATK